MPHSMMRGALKSRCLAQGREPQPLLSRRVAAACISRRRCTPHAPCGRSRAGNIAAVLAPQHTGDVGGPDLGQSSVPITPITSLQQLPAPLRNNVALLEAPNAAAAGGVTRVFVLAASHVSRVSCDQVRQLVHLVRPEMVMVELCKDRVGLLVDSTKPNRLPETWHCRSVRIEGLPQPGAKNSQDAQQQEGMTTDQAEGWPSEADLRGLLRVTPGLPISQADIEADVATLIRTGLFLRVRPVCEPATTADAPSFAVARAHGDPLAQPDLKLVAPLGAVRYVTEPRIALPLPSALQVRVDSSMRSSGVGQEAIDGVGAAVLADAVPAGTPGTPSPASVGIYLRACRALAGLFGGEAVVALSGVESGRVEALVRARRGADPAWLGGLEASVSGAGEGLGVEPFRPLRPSLPLSPRMLLPAEVVGKIAAERYDAEALAPPQGWQARTDHQAWTQEQIAACAPPLLPAAPVTGMVGRTLTGAFGRLQDRAGKAAGVQPGAAWRAALQAATEVGSQQLVLGDRPAPISERRLADEMTGAVGAAMVGSVALLAAGAWATAFPASLQAVVMSAGMDSGVLPAAFGTPAVSAATIMFCLIGSGSMLWPVLGPLIEVWRFSQLRGAEVEAAVALPEPVQEGVDIGKPLKLWGEDALLDWPGAWQRLITERDAYMAGVLAAAALGLPAGAPAMVATDDCGPLLWRFMAAQRAPAAASPIGLGDAEYAPLPAPHAIVAVVGSAHVRGICRQWDTALHRAQSTGSAQLDDLLCM